MNSLQMSAHKRFIAWHQREYLFVAGVHSERTSLWMTNGIAAATKYITECFLPQSRIMLQFQPFKVLCTKQ